MQCPGDLSPSSFSRQELTAAPYAIYATASGSANYAYGAPWSGITERPAGLDDGDDDTQYTNGSGLNLAGHEFSINPTYTQRRVSSTCATGRSIREILEDGTVVCEIDDGTSYLAGSGISLVGNTFSIDPAYTQRRVSKDCAVGSSIRAINSDGTVDCQSNLTGRPSFNISALDTSGQVGEHTSITIGADGLGLISYYGEGFGDRDLKVAHCNDINCTSATANVIYPTGYTGYYTSITIGTDGLGLISFTNMVNKDLLVAHCSDIACSSAYTTIIDSSGEVGDYSSIIMGVDGLGLISYYDYTNGDLKVAHCIDILCSSASISLLDTPSYMGVSTSITIGADGLGLIAYTNPMNGDLKSAHCDNIDCTSATLSIIDTGGVAYYNSLTTGLDGLGLISFHDNATGDLKVAHCNDSACSVATISTLDSLEDVGAYSSLTIGSDGLGLISYHDATNGDLKVAHCMDINCSSATTFALETTGDVGTYTSITIGSDGFGLISYFDITNGDLKVVHCNNNFCIPYTSTAVRRST